MAEWFEDEFFWEKTHAFNFSKLRLDEASVEIDDALTLTGVTQGRALDMGCGPGTHCLPLAMRGFAVTGVDLNPSIIDEAKWNAHRAGLEIEYVVQDSRQFLRPAVYDLALMMFNSFGYFVTAEDDAQTLRNIGVSLNSNGILLIETITKENMARHFQRTALHRDADGSILVIERQVIDDWTRCRETWNVVPNRGRAEQFEISYKLYAASELKALLHHAGFAHIELFSDFKGGSYDLEARRLVAIARRSHSHEDAT
jgi:SAM-dependent methyltransferase